MSDQQRTLVREWVEHGVHWQEYEVRSTYVVPVHAQEGWGLGGEGIIHPSDDGKHEVAFHRDLISTDHPMFARLRLPLERLRSIGEQMLHYADDRTRRAEAGAPADPTS